MKFLGLFTFLLFSLTISAQEDFLAKQYFADGDFEKAVVFYEKLAKKSPRRTDFLQGLIACYQQLERYEDAENYLRNQLNQRNPHPTLLIEMGYNYSLQDLPEKASEYYDEALEYIAQNPNYGYALGYQFQKYSLLDRAILAYQKSMELNPALDYNYQLARIYGEQGDIERMYNAYLELLANNKTSKSNILRSIDDFVTNDPEDVNNQTLRMTLLQRAQKNPDILWNELLSWLFVKQKQFSSALRQEKAIYKRMEGSTTGRLENLGAMALEENENSIAKDIFEYIKKESSDPITQLNAELHLIDIALEETGKNQLDNIQKQYEGLIDKYGYQSQTLQLQVAYANFLTFKRNDPSPAIDILKNSLELPLNERSKAYIKLALGDILVYDKRFNEALIYFSQVQDKLKNDVMGQNARYKVAETSFYKGDFDWALTQLKVLRGSTSQLIANDAMQLSLLISDNSLEDSTQTALKKYARADFLAYQNKTDEAIEGLNDILENHKGEKIEDEALLKQAQLLESQKKYEAAELNYQKIIEFYGNGILADDAYFALGELYRNILDQPEKAKAHYERIIYDYQDSYYFPQARKNFRILRGDAIN
ncbi:tetratricopeptide repeat protein [Maribacter sp. PR1]|uniref:Tetratricopeptide repeat protein n=1 Tax=Maribacter cobaltidurans TaxID=1178778 RepID=A0ABU7IPT5_9FLAO|nr:MULTISPECIES: tetratricopeptide repeat protein [Maribacter]MDC6387577.1 tetratricopeptide repeat protein [Maribacter sp. PR1]MEE1974965.1 tetratricopeptide repeat protein [Maribacter cobaltidurans]